LKEEKYARIFTRAAGKVNAADAAHQARFALAIIRQVSEGAQSLFGFPGVPLCGELVLQTHQSCPFQQLRTDLSHRGSLFAMFHESRLEYFPL
jgi:hypothetical protein